MGKRRTTARRARAWGAQVALHTHSAAVSEAGQMPRSLEACFICLEGLLSGGWQTLPCGHVMHEAFVFEMKSRSVRSAMKCGVPWTTPSPDDNSAKHCTSALGCGARRGRAFQNAPDKPFLECVEGSSHTRWSVACSKRTADKWGVSAAPNLIAMETVMTCWRSLLTADCAPWEVAGEFQARCGEIGQT